jgi:anti-anti-sigma factor
MSSTDVPRARSRTASGLPRINVRLGREGTPGYVAVVSLNGEHDLATSEGVRVALAPLLGAVLVDLSRCDFVDSTVIGVLLERAEELTSDGYRLELVAPPEGSSAARALEITGVAELVRVLPRSSSPARPLRLVADHSELTL